MSCLDLSVRRYYGPEFAGRALEAWAYANGLELRFIRPGKPIENAYVESFNGKFRDECLNEHWFVSLADAKAIIEAWRVDYNTVRPHGSLGQLTPTAYAAAACAAPVLAPLVVLTRPRLTGLLRLALLDRDGDRD